MAEVEDIEPEEKRRRYVKNHISRFARITCGCWFSFRTLFFVGFFEDKPEGEQAEEAIAALEEEIEETENAGAMEPKTLEIDKKFRLVTCCPR